MKISVKRRIVRVKAWIKKRYIKRKNTYIIKDQGTNQYLDTIYAKNTKRVMKIFSRRLRKGKRGLYKKRYTGNGIIIENKDWYKSLEE